MTEVASDTRVSIRNDEKKDDEENVSAFNPTGIALVHCIGSRSGQKCRENVNSSSSSTTETYTHPIC